MLKRIFLFTAVAGLLAACSGPASSQPPAEEADGPAGAATLTGEGFGDEIDAEGAISYADLLQQIEGKDSLAVKVQGEVAEVCQMKGCWMNITGGDQADLFVQFKDYGFFMPKDIAGREVIMEGYAYRETTSVEDLRHFAEDAGKSPEEIAAITEPKEELKFLASGVLLIAEK